MHITFIFAACLSSINRIGSFVGEEKSNCKYSKFIVILDELISDLSNLKQINDIKYEKKQAMMIK